MDNKNELNYDFDLRGATYHVVQERKTVFILDCEGETIFSFDNYLPTGTAFPVEMAKIIIEAYEKGASDGESTGYFRCQYQIQKALGIK